MLCASNIPDELKRIIVLEVWRKAVQVAKDDGAEPRKSFIPIDKRMILGHRMEKRRRLQFYRFVSVFTKRARPRSIDG